MTLTELITELKKSSGNTGLSTDRAVYFLNAALRFLQGQLSLQERLVYKDSTLAVGSYTISLPEVQAIEKVYFYDTAEEAYAEIPYVTYKDMVSLYAAMENTDTGTPSCWSYNPDTAVSGQSWGAIPQIIMMPPTDTAYTIRILYRASETPFSSASLTATNGWAYLYPDLLILAALYQIDLHYGFSERASAYLSGIQAGLDSIDKNKVRREAIVGNEMERDVEVKGVSY